MELTTTEKRTSRSVLVPASNAERPCPLPPPAPRPSAAEAVFGAALESIRTDVEQRWRKECEPRWRDRHARAAALRHRLTSLDQAVPEHAADVDSLWDKARVLLDLDGDVAARPLLRQILSIRPTHVAANFHLGRAFLDAGNDEGETFLERAMAEDEQLVPQACGLLHDYYRRLGRSDKLRQLTSRLDRYERDLAASRAERSTVTPTDPLIPHGLSADELAALREMLAAEPELVAAQLGRKDLRHFPKQKLFLLCIHVRRAWHRRPNRDREQALVNRLSQALRLPGRVVVFAPSGSFRALARKLRQVPDCAVYRRAK